MGSSGSKIQRDARKRPTLEITLSPEERSRLQRIADKHYEGNKSRTVAAMVMAFALAMTFVLAGCGGSDGVDLGNGSHPPVTASVDPKTDSGPPSSCIPLTCAAVWPSCAVWNDNCGGTVKCDPCGPGSMPPPGLIVAGADAGADSPHPDPAPTDAGVAQDSGPIDSGRDPADTGPVVIVTPDAGPSGDAVAPPACTSACIPSYPLENSVGCVPGFPTSAFGPVATYAPTDRVNFCYGDSDCCSGACDNMTVHTGGLDTGVCR